MTRFLIVSISRDGEDEESAFLTEKVDAKIAKLKDTGKIRIFEIEASEIEVSEVDPDGNTKEIPFTPVW